MDAIERLDQATAHAAGIMKGVTPEDFGKPTPCPEFDVRALLNHVFVGFDMLTSAALTGKGTFDPSVDIVSDDPGSQYAEGREKLMAAWRAEGILAKPLEMPFGTMPGEMVAGIAFMEHLTHAWDVAKATGQDPTLPEDLASDCLEAVTPMDAMLRGPGIFGPKVEVAADAPITDRLIGFLGRQP